MSRNPVIRRPLGLDDDGSAIMEPDNTSSALIIGGIGSGKTTCAIMPAVQAMIADRTRSLIISDPKNGELASQVAPLAQKLGRKFAVIDPYDVLGAGFPGKKHLNEVSGLITAFEQEDPAHAMLIKGTALTLIPEPHDDQKNHYWRFCGRERIEFGLQSLLMRSSALCSLGGLAGLLGDYELFDRIVDLEAEDAPDRAHRSLAVRIRQMRERNPEHHFQHMVTANSALDLFEQGPLHTASLKPTITHEEILRDNWVVCFVTPARFIEQIGVYAAAHFNTLLSLQLTGQYGRADFIVDEAPSGPFHPFFQSLNVIRGVGGRMILAGVSRAAFIKRYGEKVFAMAEENCRVKQYLQIATPEEAERLIKAAGEEKTVSANVGLSSDRGSYSTNINTGKENRFTVEMLLNMPRDRLIIQVAGVGTMMERKVQQNNLDPTCHWLGENHVEGGRLPPEPLITLPMGLEGVK